MNLSKVSNIIQHFFTEHLQVQTVMNANAKDFIANRDKEYTAVCFEFINSNINGKVHNYNFNITIGDLLNETHSNENIIYSDCIAIAEDFFTYMYNVDGLIFNRSSNIQKFEDGDGDRISGITFNIALGVIRAQNSCVIPIDLPLVTSYFPYTFPMTFGD